MSKELELSAFGRTRKSLKKDFKTLNGLGIDQPTREIRALLISLKHMTPMSKRAVQNLNQSLFLIDLLIDEMNPRYAANGKRLPSAEKPGPLLAGDTPARKIAKPKFLNLDEINAMKPTRTVGGMQIQLQRLPNHTSDRKPYEGAEHMQPLVTEVRQQMKDCGLVWRNTIWANRTKAGYSVKCYLPDFNTHRLDRWVKDWAKRRGLKNIDMQVVAGPSNPIADKNVRGVIVHIPYHPF